MISRTVRRRLKKCLLWMEVLFILVLGAGVGVIAGAFYQISKVLPPQSFIKSYKTPAGTTICSSDKVLLARPHHVAAGQGAAARGPDRAELEQAAHAGDGPQTGLLRERRLRGPERGAVLLQQGRQGPAPRTDGAERRHAAAAAPALALPA